MRRATGIAIAASALVAGTVIVVTAPSASAAAACIVDWRANQWNTGFTAEVKVTNNGSAISSWTLGWTWSGNQRVTSGWNATITQSGAAVTAGNVGWNGALGTGASASFGFQGTYSGTNDKPAEFTFNGASCSGDVAPSPSPSSVLPSVSVPVSPSASAPASPSASAPASPSVSAPVSPSVSTPPVPGSGETFENLPAGALSGAWSSYAQDCTGTGTATIDKAVGHTGSSSLRINGGVGYCNHIYAKNTQILGSAAGSGPLYVRYWVRHTTALPGSHITMVTLTDANDGNRDLRFGGQNGALQWNRASDDATLPEQSPDGVALSRPLPTGTWNCVEFKVDQSNGTMETWLNGTSVPGLLQDGVKTHNIDGQWLNKTYRPKLLDLKLGWESYGEGADTLWYDDVQAGTSRINC